ncbi:rhodanese-like domain-containing protein [Protaetiibacter larvae]|uniref:Sulfurtransferase n=1 Tax=Protaetiibacter larvae TaxID=2592654 RepID=A0A5C1Y9U4_9MICO|nr:rhodanese-like domain-containing protein [Protaetiibacter larvae]QEO10671.1 sulfurtransferase [Protaetiibacter larvae]
MSGPDEVTPGELHALIEAGDDLQLVDVRETWETELAVLPGALVLPLGRLPELTEALDPDRLVVTYCHHGIRSAQAAAYLEGIGFEVRHLAGGIDAWAEELDPGMRRY